MLGAQIGDDLNPIRVLALFSAITDEACELLDLAGRPENLIMTHLPVPPVCIRPSVEMDSGGGTNEDDITMKLMVRSVMASSSHIGSLGLDASAGAWAFELGLWCMSVCQLCLFFSYQRRRSQKQVVLAVHI